MPTDTLKEMMMAAGVGVAFMPTAAPTAAPTVAPQAPQSSNTALVGALIVMAIIAVGCVCAAVYFFNKSKKS